MEQNSKDPDTAHLAEPEMSESKQTEDRANSNRSAIIVLALMAGVLIGAAAYHVFAPLSSSTPIEVSADSKSIQLSTEEPTHQLAEMVMNEALSAVEKTKEAIKSDNIQSSDKFFNVNEYFPEISNEIPEKVKPFFSVIFKKDAQGYKVLAGSQICPLVSSIHPDKVDKTRAHLGPFCHYFGVWNEAGTAF